MGISVKCRSRTKAGSEKEAITFPFDEFDKANAACTSFGCDLYYALVVDASDVIRCFLLPFDAMKRHATGVEGKQRYWQMSDSFLHDYCNDAEIQRLELKTTSCNWLDATP